MLSIFGAAYTATSAIKNWLNDSLRKKLEDTKEQADFVILNFSSQEYQVYVDMVKKYHGKARLWGTVWCHSFAVPTILFVGWSFFIGLYVYFCSSPLAAYSWERWKIIIPLFIVVDVLSIIIAVIAYALVARASQHVSEFLKIQQPQQGIETVDSSKAQQGPTKKNGPNSTPKQ
jgi:hypothetical protein